VAAYESSSHHLAEYLRFLENEENQGVYAVPDFLFACYSQADFQERINEDPIALADRLAPRLHFDPDGKKFRISK